MFSRTLKMAFWVAYDHLLKLMLINLLCILLLTPVGVFFYGAIISEDSPPFILGAVLAFGVIFGILLPIMMSGLAFMTKEIIETREGFVGSFFLGIRRFALRAIMIGLVTTGSIGALLVSAMLYVDIFSESYPLLGFTFAAFALWGAAFVALTAMYSPVTLVQKGAGVIETVKLSALLVVGNLKQTLGLALVCFIIGIASLAPPVLFLFSLAPLVVVVSSGYEMMSRRYDGLASENADDLLRRPTILYNDEEDDFLNRGARDFFYPWKS